MKTPVIFAVLMTAALPLAAQEAPADAAADLAAMRAKAEADPEVSRMFEQIERSVGRQSNAPSRKVEDIVRDLALRNMLRNTPFGLSDILDEPVKIATLAGLEPARQRANAASQVLQADLDGDWQITREEIVEAARYQRIDGAAQAFLTADTDRNDILTFEEIKVAVDGMVAGSNGRRNVGPNLLPVFDFDDDGYLTQGELDRGIAALTAG
jgi:hypothetical protein